MHTDHRQIGNDLTEGPIFAQMIRYVMPVVFANLIQQFYSMVDLMVIGNFAGTTGTVGVSVGSEIPDFLSPIAINFASAAQIYIAQLSGAKRYKERTRTMGSFITMMLMVSVMLSVLVISLRVPLLKMINCPESAFGQAENYLLITTFGLPFVFGYNAVCGILRGMGESRRPLLFVIISSVVNIFLDLLLVAVFSLDAAGTAIATTASQFAAFAAALGFMYRNKRQIGFDFKAEHFRIDLMSTKIILKLGIPQAVRTSLVRMCMLWVTANINAYGLVIAGANSIGTKIMKLLEVFAQSICTTGGAMVGQNLGARKHERVKKTVRYEAALCMALALIISAALLVFPTKMYSLFTSDTEVIAVGIQYLRIMAVFFLISAITSAYMSLIIGVGNAFLNFIIGIIDGVLCRVGLSLIFVYILEMGAYGYFWGNALCRAIPGAICIIYFHFGNWKEKVLFKTTDS